MRERSLLTAIVVLCLPASNVYAQRLPLPDSLIDLYTVQGEQLPRNTNAFEPNILLHTKFVTQKTQASCDVAAWSLISLTSVRCETP